MPKICNTHSYERKRNPEWVANLHSERQGLKPKGESNSSFLVVHPSSGEDIVNTVGSHLKLMVRDWKKWIRVLSC